MFASIIMSLILAASPSVEACKKKYPNSNLSCEHPISLPRPPEPECVPYCDASGHWCVSCAVGGCRDIVALQPSADVTYFLPAPVIEDAWEQQGDAWVRSSASAVFGDDIGVQVGPISSAASKKPPMSATDLHDLVVRASDCAQRRARDSQSTNRERGIRGVPPAAGCDTRGPAPVSESTAALTSSSTGCEYGTGG